MQNFSFLRGCVVFFCQIFVIFSCKNFSVLRGWVVYKISISFTFTFFWTIFIRSLTLVKFYVCLRFFKFISCVCLRNNVIVKSFDFFYFYVFCVVLCKIILRLRLHFYYLFYILLTRAFGAWIGKFWRTTRTIKHFQGLKKAKNRS